MTTFSIKILALICMVIDHIGLFFPDTPIWYRYIGRISAPLFIFCMVIGFSYTRNRKVYLLRMYLFGLGMSVLDYILNYFSKGDLVTNNIFVTLFSIAIIIQLIEYIREKHRKWIIYLLCYCVWQIVSLLICYHIDMHYDKLVYLFMGLLGNLFYNEGGFIFVFLGVLLYFIKDNKKFITIYYSLFCFSYAFITMAGIVPRIMSKLDYYDYNIFYNIFGFIFPLLGFNIIGINKNSIQWMMIGALPFMLLYNGEKGKSIKYLFYIFYPAHILILFILSNIILK